MCGIVGVTGIPDAARAVFLGLYALQHRGQESAGIAAVDASGVARLVKREGLVSETVDEALLATLPGSLALGHTRYSTAGGAGLANAQPILVRYREGNLGLAHNGNLTNARGLRRELVAEGALFQGTIDSEVLVHLIARSRAADVGSQIAEALGRIQGAYSVVLLAGDALYAARDPWGFRPLSLGRMPSGGWMVASETCALDLVGARHERDLEPGELVVLQGDRPTTLRRQGGGVRPAPCVFELVYFARPDSKVFGTSVDRARRAFGRALAREHPADADMVISVPDSSNSAALGFAEESGLPFELGLIRNHYVGRTFIHPIQSGRDFRVRVKFNAVREIVGGKRVVVVDDSLVRGTTSQGLVKLLREAGAAEVHFRLSSPPVVGPCYYGIDLPTKEELLGARHSVEEIRDLLHVDSLGYLSREGMLEAAAAAGPCCDACFSGHYPAPLVDRDAGEPAPPRG